ncbi:MAG TPA: PQQ-binding-like beta-propeller repeat protein [Tepidisphaeraceae bacterium]|nr:PQQ-binding-like beta-propeller repeat protein [Tepidisphaeraceae bacterium]
MICQPYLERIGSLLVIAFVAANGNPALADWPQFLGPTRNGVCADLKLATTFPPAGPPIVWKRDVGQGFAGPVVAGGKLVLFNRVDDKEKVECLDAKSGKTLWAADYPTAYQDDFGFDEGPRATPAIAGGRVYTYGAEGALNCWDLASGRNIWAVETKKQFAPGKGFFGMACSPLVEGNAVIVNIGGGDGAGVVAFEAGSGKVLWKATNDAASYSSPAAATIHGKRYVLSLTRAGLVALDPANGKVYFDFPYRSRMNASVNAATPLVIDDRIFVSASYGTGAALLQFDEKGPTKIWAGDNILSNHYATSVYADGFLYGFDGRQESGPNLRCVELKTGKVRWSEDHFGAGTILLAGKELVVLTEKGELILAPATAQGFKPTARAQVLAFNVRAYPALADGCLYARSTDKLVCVQLGKP